MHPRMTYTSYCAMMLQLQHFSPGPAIQLMIVVSSLNDFSTPAPLVSQIPCASLQ